MDVNKSTTGPKGEDLTLLPIEKLVSLNHDTGFLIVKRLDYWPVEDCTHEGCMELAEFCLFCVSSDGEHAVSYNCPEHMKALVDLAESGIEAYIRN